MRKYVPLEKMSKKAQREFHKQQRGSWYGISPVSKIVESKKKYDRNQIKRDSRTMERESSGCPSFSA